jgi:hypothetical protein
MRGRNRQAEVRQRVQAAQRQAKRTARKRTNSGAVERQGGRGSCMAARAGAARDRKAAPCRGRQPVTIWQNGAA